MPWQPDYITVAELKSYLRIDLADTTDDAELAFVVAAASRAIDQVTNRQFGQVAAVEAREYTPFFDRTRVRWVAPIDDLEDLTGLVVESLDADGVATAITDFSFHPRNSDEKGKPFERIIFGPGISVPNRQDSVRITALWGWNAVPVAIRQATLAQANRFNARREAPFGVAGSPEVGSEVRLLSKADPDVKVAVRPFTRNWAVA